MKRIPVTPRANWRQTVEEDGLRWHTEGTQCCWNEEAAYAFTQTEIDLVCRTAREVHRMCQDAAAHVAKHECWSRVGLRKEDVPIVRESWERGDWGLCGRFDFLLDDQGKPRLLEYNAETALSLVESSRVQSRWMRDVMPDATQLNHLHDSLVAAWQRSIFQQVHCAWRPRHPEVEGTSQYMARIIRQAGRQATLLPLHRLGWDAGGRRFVDADSGPVECCFKIYPWEWMLRERFARHVAGSSCRFVEPPWKLMLGSKGILPVMWEMFPDHPALVPCFETSDKVGRAYVSKPLFGHEGHNVAVHRDGMIVERAAGEYDGERRVYQAFVESPRHDGHLAQLGVWMVDGEPVALGIRESRDAIITNNSAFVPHFVAP